MLHKETIKVGRPNFEKSFIQKQGRKIFLSKNVVIFMAFGIFIALATLKDLEM